MMPTRRQVEATSDLAPTRVDIGVHLLGLEGAVSESDIQHRTMEMLARSLNMGQVVAFVGSGVSGAYGYPTWSEFAAQLVDFTLGRCIPGGGGAKSQNPPLRTTDEERDMLKTGLPLLRNGTAPGQKIFPLLDLCDELFSRNGSEAHHEFRHHAESIVRPRSRGNHRVRTDEDPLRDVMERLEIRRFLTTNYDHEIENAFERVLHCRRIDGGAGNESVKPGRQESLAVRPIARSLALGTGSAEDLVRLAVSAPGFERGVFHIHGKVLGSGQPARREGGPWLVIGERDYQRVYLQSLQPGQQAYRNALSVALTGNAILFLGLGMTEDDLLRPLRQFTAERTHAAPEVPLFALMPSPGDASERLRLRRNLYVRFGVKVIYYPRLEPGALETPRQRTRDFCAAVCEMAEFWRRWWPAWRLKPQLRKPSFFENPDKNWQIRHQVLDHAVRKSPPRPKDDPHGLGAFVTRLEQSDRRACAFLLLGRPGAGKGTIGQFLVEGGELLNVRVDYMRKFFATAHFTNDFLSTIEAAANYLGRAVKEIDNESMDPIDRLIEALKSGRHLFVLGGLERLLVPDRLELTPQSRPAQDGHAESPTTQLADEEPPQSWPVGRPMTIEVKRFLDSLLNGLRAGTIRSDIVLTSSMRPRGFHGKNVPVESFILDHLVDQDVEAADRFCIDGVADDTCKDLYFALRGHCYALALISVVLVRHCGVPAERQRQAERFLARLGAMEIDSRPARTVGLVLECMRSSQEPDHAIWPGLLQRVALFSTPVTREAVVASCLPWPKRGISRGAVLAAMEKLVGSNLLLGVGPVDQDTGQSTRVTAHTLARVHVLRELGDLPSSPGEALRFDLTGWSNDAPETLAGQGDSHLLTAQSVDSLLATLEHEVTVHRFKRRVDRDLLRAAFGLIRSRWTATTIPRLHMLPPEESLGLPLPHYDAYQRRLARLMRLLRATPRLVQWIKEPPTPRQDYEVLDDHLNGGPAKGHDAHLYADELAWLSNELSVTALCQGYLSDAEALLRSTQLINSFAERGTRGHRWYEVQISLGLVQMERGHLLRARKHIEDALQQATVMRADELRARATGHLGLVLHLQGHYDGAERCYNAAIDELSARGELRPVSIFLRHRADFRRYLGRVEEAEEDLRSSIAAAQSGRFPDLVQYGRMAEANLMRARRQNVPIEQLAPALEFARCIGVPKLESAILNVQGQIALDHGELELAERLCTTTMSIAASLGMRLNVTGGLALAGRIAKARGNVPAAQELLRSALDLAQHERFQLSIEKTQRDALERG